jgi:putative ABC transport system substrate-binding protein
MRQLAPKATTVAMLVMPSGMETEVERADVAKAAQALGLQLVVAEATSRPEIEAAFARFAQHNADAVLIGTGALTNSHQEAIVVLAARRSIPAIYSLREYVSIGGLMSYGTSITGAYRQAGIYAGRILKGERPADLPVIQSTKFELVLNLKTAKALGLTVPDKLLALADEVIE